MERQSRWTKAGKRNYDGDPFLTLMAILHGEKCQEVEEQVLCFVRFFLGIFTQPVQSISDDRLPKFENKSVLSTPLSK